MRCPLVTLGDCCEIVSGATPSTTVKEYWDGRIFWATPKDLSAIEGHFISDTPRKLTESGLASCSATILPPNSVLFSSRAPIGHVAVNTVPMATNQGFKSFVPKPDQIDAKFLFHWLRANRSYLESLGVGATFKEVSKTIVSRVEIPLPSLPEQRHIATILDKADALRAQRRAAIAKLDELLQSVFIEMFGDPVTNPKRWVIQRIGVACEKVTVGVVVKPADWYVESGIPAIRSLNIGVNSIIQNNFVYVKEADNTGPLMKTMLRAGDVVVVRSGQPGKAAVIPPSLDGANAIDVLIVRTNKEKMLPLFLSHFVNSQAGKQLVLAEQRGQVQKHLNVKQLSEAEIPLPPLDLQNRFAQIAEKIETQKQTMQRAAEKTETLFASLQQRAFSGKL